MNLLLLQPSPCWLRSVGSLCFPSVPCVLRYSIRTVIIALIGNQTAKQMTSNFHLFGRYFSLVMAESSLRGCWIPADLLIHYMNQKNNIGSNMLLTTQTLMTDMNKCYPIELDHQFTGWLGSLLTYFLKSNFRFQIRTFIGRTVNRTGSRQSAEKGVSNSHRSPGLPLSHTLVFDSILIPVGDKRI